MTPTNEGLSARLRAGVKHAVWLDDDDVATANGMMLAAADALDAKDKLLHECDTLIDNICHAINGEGRYARTVDADTLDAMHGDAEVTLAKIREHLKP